ncbi:MAG TPA: nicotinate (nicotinamide) nucleotide adenylyltransferase, partial [Burkholderiales bacterium]|nr:nicotinate (nicotinamide) nucleotide adenylyltransferase [Burkholderiales bacterium]
MATGPIGIFGGTFDPIHYGHLRLAEELAEAAKLGEVRFVPSGTPPHRARPGADAHHRVEMARLATAGNPRFVVDDRETQRAGPGYTYDTLTELRQQVGKQRPLALLLGADAFLDLATWHRWHQLFDLAHIVVG